MARYAAMRRIRAPQIATATGRRDAAKIVDADVQPVGAGREHPETEPETARDALPAGSPLDQEKDHRQQQRREPPQAVGREAERQAGTRSGSKETGAECQEAAKQRWLFGVPSGNGNIAVRRQRQTARHLDAVDPPAICLQYLKAEIAELQRLPLARQMAELVHDQATHRVVAFVVQAGVEESR